MNSPTANPNAASRFQLTAQEAATQLYHRIKKYGVAQQQSVNPMPWHAVIAVYQQMADTGKTDDGPYALACIAAMEAKIKELGLV